MYQYNLLIKQTLNQDVCALTNCIEDYLIFVFFQPGVLIYLNDENRPTSNFD